MNAPEDAVTSQMIAQAERLVRPFIRRTPVVEVDGAEFGLPAHTLTLKLELLQHSGSFKARGAFANLLTRDVPEVGVVAASGGNHGAAVAYAAMKLGKPAKIFVPSVSSPAKVQRIRDYGADLAIEGDRYADALAASETWAQRTGAMQVPAFDQNETIMGQGTIGFELAEQAPDIDTVLVAVGGGGLVAGVAAWFAGRIKVIGVEPFASPTLSKALEAGHPVDAEAGGLAADSLAPRRVGERVFPIVRKYAPQTVLVSDTAIASAQAMLWQALRIVAEPGGAAAFAAILSGAYKPAAGERVAIIVSGGNTAAVDFDLKR
jgi:threonine dehydratase